MKVHVGQIQVRNLPDKNFRGIEKRLISAIKNGARFNQLILGVSPGRDDSVVEKLTEREATNCIPTYLYFSYCSLHEEAGMAATNIKLWLVEKRLTELYSNASKKEDYYFRQLTRS